MADWLVDGNNVMGTRPDGWWRDRPAARRRLVARLGELGATTGDRVRVVFDGRWHDDEVQAGATGGVEVRFAPGGRDAADDEIVRLVAAGAGAAGAGTTVVTSDAALARRVAELGAAVTGAGAFLSLLDR